MLLCAEMPEARFLDLMRVSMHTAIGLCSHVRVPVDPVFVAVCEAGSLEVVSVVPKRSASVGATIVDGVLMVESDVDPGTVTVMISGLRKGHAGRFLRHSEEAMNRNNRFWDGWRAGQ